MGVPPPRGSEKQVAKKTRWGRNSLSMWLQNGSQHLNFWIILGNILDDFTHHLFGGFQLDYPTILQSILASLLGLFKNCSKIALKLIDLCECTLRQHGSMVFTVLAPCILVILS